MAPTLSNSNLLYIESTIIFSSDGSANVVADSGEPLYLWIEVHADLSLFGYGYKFSANFRIIEVATNTTFNHYWNGDFDGLKPYAPDMSLLCSWKRASDAGVYKTAAPYTGLEPKGTDGDGLYLYRPYFLVYAGTPEGEFIVFSGRSEFGVAEEHYFVLESS